MMIGNEDVIRGVLVRCVVLSSEANSSRGTCDHCALNRVACGQKCSSMDAIERGVYSRVALIPVSEIPRYALEGWLE